jgi:hypothetical protein
VRVGEQIAALSSDLSGSFAVLRTGRVRRWSFASGCAG